MSIDSQIKISVLICTYNRPMLLEGALESLIKKTHRKPDQVVVVNGGDSRSDAVVEKYKGVENIDLLLIKTVNVNLATSRNIGLRKCTGDIIAMTDDDGLVFPDWIQEIERAHDAYPEAGAIGGAIIGTDQKSTIGIISDSMTFPSSNKAQTIRNLPGVNVTYKKEVIEKIGFQDEKLVYSEDVDFNWRVQKAGYTVFYEPKIKVYHHHRPTIRGLMRQHFTYGVGYFRVRKKWPEIYSLYPKQIQSVKDFAKFLNFFASLFYEPFIYSKKFRSLKIALSSIPISFLVGFAWRVGVSREFLRTKIKANK